MSTRILTLNFALLSYTDAEIDITASNKDNKAGQIMVRNRLDYEEMSTEAPAHA